MRRQKGFTIIEVVLVLAIAGLIFLMIFIALPALQRGQRDTARKQDISKVAAAINSYKANNKGMAQPLSRGIIAGYLDDLNIYETQYMYVYPFSSATYSALTANYTTNNVERVNSLYIFPGKKCGAINGATVNFIWTGNPRDVLIMSGLENTGQTTNRIGYCVDV